MMMMILIVVLLIVIIIVMMIVVLIVIISPNKCKIGSDDHHLRMKRGFQRGLCHSCVRHEIHLIFKIFPLVIFNHD